MCEEHSTLHAAHHVVTHRGQTRFTRQKTRIRDRRVGVSARRPCSPMPEALTVMHTGNAACSKATSAQLVITLMLTACTKNRQNQYRRVSRPGKVALVRGSACGSSCLWYVVGAGPAPSEETDGRTNQHVDAEARFPRKMHIPMCQLLLTSCIGHRHKFPHSTWYGNQAAPVLSNLLAPCMSP